MTEALLKVEDVATGYGSVQALWDFSIDIRHGEVYCVLGPNGAGKTTMGLVVTGALPCWSGAIRFDGNDITGRSPETRARAGIAHVPQGRRVFPELTVDENLQVARFAAGKRASEETEEFVHDLFPKLGHLSKSSAGRLSGGEQQMLAVGRALMTEPRLLVLDEPSLGLAPLLVDGLYEAIVRIRTRGVSILLIEQVVKAALGVADRVMILESGRPKAAGPVNEFNEEDIAEVYMGGGKLGTSDA